MTNNNIEFIVQVDVLDHNDFDYNKFLHELKEWTEKKLGSYWSYTVRKEHHYPPTERNLIWCDACGYETIHISINGNNFRCINCEWDAIMKILHPKNYLVDSKEPITK